MVATFYVGADAVTCTNEESWIVVRQPTEQWLSCTWDEDLTDDWSLDCKTPSAIVDRVVAYAKETR